MVPNSNVCLKVYNSFWNQSNLTLKLSPLHSCINFLSWHSGSIWTRPWESIQMSIERSGRRMNDSTNGCRRGAAWPDVYFAVLFTQSHTDAQDSCMKAGRRINISLYDTPTPPQFVQAFYPRLPAFCTHQLNVLDTHAWIRSQMPAWIKQCVLMPNTISTGCLDSIGVIILS